MPVGLAGTLHDLVALYSKRAQAVPQLVAMHYAVEVRTLTWSVDLGDSSSRTILHLWPVLLDGPISDQVVNCHCPRSPTPVLVNGVNCLGFATHDPIPLVPCVHEWSTFLFWCGGADAALLSSNALGINPAHGHQTGQLAAGTSPPQ